MATLTSPYDSISLEDLRVRTEYEVWFLEAVYEITDKRLAVEDVDELIYPANGGSPSLTICGVGNIISGDWRPRFLNAGAPLIFVSAFKLLDMILEWILEKNGKPSTHKFTQKIAALKGSVKFPLLIETRQWLKDRLIALYNGLEPLRGTIIHARHFKAVDGMLQVSSSKGGTIGPLVMISATDLRNLALVLVSILRYLEGTWSIDIFQEKRLRWTFDKLVHLHALPSLGQLPPYFLKVRVYVPAEERIQCDLLRIWRDVATARPGEDIMFDLRIITVASNGSHAKAYLVPWDELQEADQKFNKTLTDLAPYIVKLPSGIDIAAIAREMK